MEKPPQRQHHDPATSSTASTDLPDPATPEPDPPITKPQLTKLHTTLTNIGITDRDDYLTLCEHIIGYQVASTKNLTKNEAHQLINTLDNWQTDETYPINDRLRDLLNTAALAEAEQEDSTE